jgi:hypothetical protein
VTIYERLFVRAVREYHLVEDLSRLDLATQELLPAIDLRNPADPADARLLKWIADLIQTMNPMLPDEDLAVVWSWFVRDTCVELAITGSVRRKSKKIV